MQTRVISHRHAEAVIIAAEGRLGFAELPQLEEALRAAQAPEDFPVVVDLTRVRSIDSSVLGWFIRQHVQRQRQGGRILFANPQPPVRRTFQVTRTGEVLELYPSMEQALRVLEKTTSQAS